MRTCFPRVGCSETQHTSPRIRMRISFLDQSRDQIRDSEPPIVCMINGWARCSLFGSQVVRASMEADDDRLREDDRSRGA